LVDDSSLVGRARKGDRAAFELLVRRHYRAAFAVALGILGRTADAEDVCQDAWIRALERLETLRAADRFAPWLLQIVRNAARNRLDYLRLRRAEPLESESASGRADPRQDLARQRLRIRLEAVLGELSVIQREIVLLHDLEGWDHRAIGGALGISEVHSRQHLFQARRRLRELLGDDAQEELGHGG
jgi:RNA polymerase sigma-70 factor, ECF subfamily